MGSQRPLCLSSPPVLACSKTGAHEHLSEGSGLELGWDPGATGRGLDKSPRALFHSDLTMAPSPPSEGLSSPVACEACAGPPHPGLPVLLTLLSSLITLQPHWAPVVPPPCHESFPKFTVRPTERSSQSEPGSQETSGPRREKQMPFSMPRGKHWHQGPLMCSCPGRDRGLV